jgi:ribosomal protein S18 acetylase RimI-like enzyme
MGAHENSFASDNDPRAHLNITSMKIKTRKAKKEDIEAIMGLNKQLADYHRKIDGYWKPSSKTRKSFKKHLSNIIQKKTVKILVAENDERLIGYFIGSIEKAQPFVVPKKIGRISDAFVEEKYRELGIGKKMFGELIIWFKRNKIKHVELSVDSRNETAIRTWQNFGFREFMKKMRLDL